MSLRPIDPASPTPPFEQLRSQLLAQMQAGDLAAGTRLPTVRQLASDLGIAPGTVARAYKELEAAGAIETRGRAGTFVAWSPDAGERRIQELATQLAAVARELGVPADRVRAALGAALDA
ncbi:MAG: GntR family transcriptional regulator [Actinomycetota bacterium]|nr:GntR family transcriptional regulator [Actinomycetota bacterium]HET8895722.1 GntR family transcriptional regulator [Protaetiibacter sp.]